MLSPIVQNSTEVSVKATSVSKLEVGDVVEVLGVATKARGCDGVS